MAKTMSLRIEMGDFGELTIEWDDICRGYRVHHISADANSGWASEPLPHFIAATQRALGCVMQLFFTGGCE